VQEYKKTRRNKNIPEKTRRQKETKLVKNTKKYKTKLKNKNQHGPFI